MTREDIRRLIGGFATGSLPEAERKTLFEAALEDQELFDELAREQALKDLIESPGARDRLLRAVEPKRSRTLWPWAAAVAAAAVVAGVFLLKTPAPREIAQVARQEQAVTTPQAPASAPPPESARPTAVEPPKPKPRAAPRAEPRAEMDSASAQNAAAEKKAVPAVPFEYVILPEGRLRVTPSKDGFLIVTALAANASPTLLASLPVTAGTPAEIEIPNDAVSARLSFRPGPPRAAGGAAGAAVAPAPALLKSEAPVTVTIPLPPRR